MGALSLIIGPRSLCVSLCRVSVSPSSACLIECVICFLISTLFSTLFFYDDECSFVFSRLRFSTVCVVIENISTRLYSLSPTNCSRQRSSPKPTKRGAADNHFYPPSFINPSTSIHFVIWLCATKYILSAFHFASCVSPCRE